MFDINEKMHQTVQQFPSALKVRKDIGQESCDDVQKNPFKYVVNESINRRDSDSKIAALNLSNYGVLRGIKQPNINT